MDELIKHMLRVFIVKQLLFKNLGFLKCVVIYKTVYEGIVEPYY